MFFYPLGQEHMMGELEQLRKTGDYHALEIAIHEIGGWHQMWLSDNAGFDS